MANARPRYDVLPSAGTLADSLRSLGAKVPTYRRWMLKRPGELDKFRAEMWDSEASLQARGPGSMADLLAIWTHTSESKENPLNLQSAIERCGGATLKRQNRATVNLQAAAQTLEVALLLHTAKDTWFANSVISQCRIALELAAKAVFIATGADDEVGRWESAHMLKDKRKRKQAEIKMSECLDVLEPLLAASHASADPVGKVYGWLCHYVHFSARTLKREPRHDAAYAALAYVGWVIAVAAEVVTGLKPIAEWPKSWPAHIPWR